MEGFDAVRILSPIESAKEYVCCSKLFRDLSPNRLEISLSDGESMWKKSVDAPKNSTGMVAATIYDMNDCLREGRVELKTADDVSLTLYCHDSSEPNDHHSPVSLQLTALVGKEELGSLVMNLAKKTTQLTAELKECKQALESAGRAKVASAVPDMPIKSGGKAQNKPRKPAGHSIVNPSSKRRKAAKGVVWNEDDQ